MQIKIEDCAPKNIINFYLSREIAPAGSFIVAKMSENTDSLADRIMNIAGVERCLIAPTVVSVKHNGAAEDIKLLTMAEIDDFCTEGRTAMPENNSLSPTEQAEALADAFIRPTLNRDNGDIVIHGIVDNVLELSFAGHCAGCPYAQNTLQNVVTRAFKQYMPQIKEVHLKEA